MESDGEQSLVVAVEMCGNEFRVSLGDGTLPFYQLLLTNLKFLEKSRWEQAIENRMLVAYLPVSYNSPKADNAFYNLDPFQESYGGAERLQSLHKSAECAL